MPGWRNWQTQRTQNPPIARSWGFDPPSRHQDYKRLISGPSRFTIKFLQMLVGSIDWLAAVTVPFTLPIAELETAVVRGDFPERPAAARAAP